MPQHTFNKDWRITIMVKILQTTSLGLSGQPRADITSLAYLRHFHCDVRKPRLKALDLVHRRCQSCHSLEHQACSLSLGTTRRLRCTLTVSVCSVACMGLTHLNDILSLPLERGEDLSDSRSPRVPDHADYVLLDRLGETGPSESGTMERDMGRVANRAVDGWEREGKNRGRPGKKRELRQSFSRGIGAVWAFQETME